MVFPSLVERKSASFHGRRVRERGGRELLRIRRAAWCCDPVARAAVLGGVDEEDPNADDEEDDDDDADDEENAEEEE